MAMPGKDATEDKSSLDLNSAERTAEAFRPSWAADYDVSDGKDDVPPPPSDADLAERAAEAFRPSWAIDDDDAPTRQKSNAPSLRPSAPPGASMSKSSSIAPMADGRPHRARVITQLGVAPPANVVTTPRPLPLPPQKPTIIGGISVESAVPESAAASASAPSEAPDTEALDSTSIIASSPLAPPAAATAPMPEAPPPVPRASKAPPSAAPPPTTQAMDDTPPPPSFAAPLIAADPFRDVPPPEESVPDLRAYKKRLNVRTVAVALGALVMGIGAWVTANVLSEEAMSTPTAPTGSVALAPPPGDIPPPPPKEEVAPPATVKAATTKTGDRAHHARADTKHAANANASDPPKVLSAAPGPAPKAKSSPPAQLTPPPSKSPPKQQGGIVRDNPF